MRQLKDHVKAALDTMHEHHQSCAKVHSSACDDPSASDGQRAFHKSMADQHTRMADCMKGMSADCDKTADMVDLAKVISQVADASVKAEFTRAGLTPPATRLIQRAGDPPLLKAEESEQVTEIFG
jgi:hypothetical protein